MILTGKAKEDFEKWLLTDGNVVIKNGTKEYDLYYMCKYMIPENMVYSKIIEWLDSVDIYVSTEYIFSEGFTCCIETFENTFFTYTEETRKEATNQAITKANEIYNYGNSRIKGR